MEISLPGVIVIAVLLAISRLFGSALVIAAIASCAFGATAIVILVVVGNSSPLIYVVPCLMLVAAVACRRLSLRQIETLLGRDPTVWLVILLAIYAGASAFIMPRLFDGVTSAFVNSRATGLSEVPLAPTSGNVTQSAYFILGALTFLAFGTVMMHRSSLRSVEYGFLAWAGLTAFFGVLDLGGKISGAGDVLAPIRTANYAMLTGDGAVVAGFTRISGAHSEASAFAAAALASLAFTFGYWRRTGSRAAAGLATLLIVLLLLSTSTTAYVGLGVLASCLVLSIIGSAARRNFTKQDLVICAVLTIASAMLLAISLADPSIFDPFLKLFETTVVNKGDSESARGRGYWNARSLEAFLDTSGLGIGLGSSRASNWVIAVLSQLGLVGAVLFLLIVLLLARTAPAGGSGPTAAVAGLYDGARNCALTLLLAATIAGSGADPGILFFIALATACACRAHLTERLPTSTATVTGLSPRQILSISR